jgi:hypothetical protein
MPPVIASTAPEVRRRRCGGGGVAAEVWRRAKPGESRSRPEVRVGVVSLKASFCGM